MTTVRTGLSRLTANRCSCLLRPADLLTALSLPAVCVLLSRIHVQTDSYAFAVVLLELLTGIGPIEAVALHMDDPDLYEAMHQHTDARAGAWPAAGVDKLAAVAERCIAYHARSRSTIADVLPVLEELAAAASGNRPE